MTLNFGLIKQSASFDDNGSLAINQTANLHETSKKVITGTITGGSTIHTYDFDDTTSMDFINTSNTTFSNGITFDFYQKLKIRSFESYVKAVQSSGTQSAKPIAHYSVDNSTWTEIDSGVFGANSNTNLNGGDFLARYIRLGGVADGDGTAGDTSTTIFEVRIRA